MSYGLLNFRLITHNFKLKTDKKMPIYHKLGKIPPKRHTQFEKPGGGLYYEQLFGTIGFDGMSSLSYHVHRPTQVKEIGKALDVSPKIAVEKNITSRKFIGFDVAPKDDFLESREPLLVNNDVHVGLAAPKKSLNPVPSDTKTPSAKKPLRPLRDGRTDR